MLNKHMPMSAAYYKGLRKLMAGEVEEAAVADTKEIAGDDEECNDVFENLKQKKVACSLEESKAE